VLILDSLSHFRAWTNSQTDKQTDRQTRLNALPTPAAMPASVTSSTAYAFYIVVKSGMGSLADTVPPMSTWRTSTDLLSTCANLVQQSTVVDPLQARCHGVQSATWTCTKLPRATCPRRRCVWSSSTPLRRHESHLGAASHVHHRRQSSLLGRCPTNLEFSTRRRYLR